MSKPVETAKIPDDRAAGTATILIVDDLPDNLTTMANLLNPLGAHLRVANGGLAALKLAAIEPLPDLILLDIMMPDMDGHQVLAELRRAEKTRDIPVIFVTALGDDVNEVTGLAAGAADYVAKPINPAILQARVKTQLAISQARKELAASNEWLSREVERRLEENRQLHQTEEAQRALAERIVTGISDGIFVTDTQGKIVLANPAFSKITGYSAEEVLGQSPNILKSGTLPSSFYGDMWSKVYHEGEWQGEITNRHKSGALIHAWLNISSVRDPAGQISHFVAIFSDLTERKAAAERIRYLSSHDALTALPNRTLFTDRLDQALKSARRYQRGTALLILDLNHFRRINDTFGPSAGDRVLGEVTRRLSLQVREGDTVGRLSGNEFGFVLAHLAHEHDAFALANRMLEAIAEPLKVGDESLSITASIGISLAPKDGENSEQLLKCADASLLRAKQAGSNTFRFYSPEMDADATRRLGLESALRHALEKNELSIHYQPQVSLDSGKLLGMEALLRWKSSQFGQVSPAEFIPIAEDSGQIIAIGEWVLREACRQTKEWLDLGRTNLRVAVNLSAKQFRQPDLLTVVKDALAQSGLPAEALELEITESSLMEDVDEAIAVCHEIKAAGIKISLDDFGTGYSSLAYISRFPFDKLKIDQGFVRDITNNPVNAAIATAAIVMARSLNLTVLAEGVETEAQASFLRGRRCDAIQGYLFSRPVPANEFIELLHGHKQLPINQNLPNGLPTLLLVDDEPNILSALSRLLRREGYQILTAESPAIGFELLAKHPVEVVLCDQRMPGMSGSEFLGRVRQLYPDTVRLVLTGYTDIESVTEAINKGAVFKFLTKPWDDDELREQIRTAFRIANDLRHHHPNVV